MIRHIVFFRAKDRADIPAMEAGLRMLTAIPAARRLEIRRNTKVDGFSNETDLVVYGEFDDAEALAAYKAHPLYAEAIRVVRPLRDLRFAADIPAEAE